MMILVYFVAIWFQAIEDITEYESGIGMLPLVLALVVGSAMSGGLTSAAGHYTPFMILGTVLMAVSGGLLTTFYLETTKAQWIGYRVLFGLAEAKTCKCPAWQGGLFLGT
jgi:MFS family permease